MDNVKRGVLHQDLGWDLTKSSNWQRVMQNFHPKLQNFGENLHAKSSNEAYPSGSITFKIEIQVFCYLGQGIP